MTETPRANDTLSRPAHARLGWLGAGTPRAAAALAFAGSVLAAAPALAQRGGMVLNSTTNPEAERYHQQAAEGRKKHDFSPRTPPRGGRMIYGHWTPYNPPDPSSLPADARKHVIQRGDTLWDISGKYFKDNYLWPYIWEANSWVTYPHWIYPGDTLVVSPLMMLPEGKLEEEVAVIPHPLAAFYPAGGEDAIYCGHFIADPNVKEMGEIIATETDPQPTLLSGGNLVYINLGAKDGILPGDEFAILYPREHLAVNPAELKHQKDDQLVHPLTGEKLGVVMKMAGRLKVVLLGEAVSTAEIVRACDAIEVGWSLRPFTEVPIPLVRRHTTERLANEMPREGRGHIIWVEDSAMTGAYGKLVSIDLGSNHGVIPGDVFRIFRDEAYNPFSLEIEHLGQAWDTNRALREASHRRDPQEKTIYGKQDPVVVTPPRMVGELVVLYTEDNTATARVLAGEREFYIGDQVVYEAVDSGLSSVAVVDAPLANNSPFYRQPRDLGTVK